MRTLSRLLLIIGAAGYISGIGASHYYDKREYLSEIVKRTYFLETKINGLDSLLKNSCSTDSIYTECSVFRKEYEELMSTSCVVKERKDNERNMKHSRNYTVLAMVSILPFLLGVIGRMAERD